MTRGAWTRLAAGLAGSVASLALVVSGLAVASDSRGAARPTGWLWHGNYALNRWSGMQVASLDGLPPVSLSTSTVALTPWPDGRRYVTTQWHAADAATRLTVVERSSGAAVQALSVPGYLRAVQPSPADPRLLKVVWSEGFSTPVVDTVIDLQSQRALRQIAAQDLFAWLPDGRMLLVDVGTGLMRASRVDGAGETPVGQLRWPADSRPGPLWVSPSGAQLVVRLQRISRPDESDLWIAAIDGTGLEPLTDSRRSFNAQWSPDGRFVAYDTDASRACSGTVCMGTCQLWYTTSDLRRVRGLQGTPGSSGFQVTDRFGPAAVPLGCPLVGWTP